MKIKDNIFIKMFLTLIFSICLGFLILYCLYLIPTERMVNNARQSETLYIDNENKVNNWVGSLRYGRLDNSTDAIMINIALCRAHDSNLDNVLLNPYYYADEKEDINFSASDLRTFLYDANIGGSSDYARYWHGYLLYLIPALNFFDVGGIRTLMLMVQFLLIMMLLYEISKYSPIYMFSYAIALLFINPITTALNMQNADVFIISIIFSILIIKKNDYFISNNRYVLLFMFIGISTCYFDFLTYPLVSWGLPIITYFIVNKTNIKGTIKNIALFSFAWIFGYFGMWTGKWILSSILTNTNVILEAIKQIAYRSGGSKANGETISFYDVLYTTYESFNSPQMFLMFILSFIVIVVWAHKNNKEIIINISFLKENLPFFIILFGPFAWYFILKNHSQTHSNLEYRTIVITLLCLLIIFSNLFKSRKQINDKY